MKKIFVIGLLLLFSVASFGAYGGRFADRNWIVQQISCSGNAQRFTNTKSGSIWIQAGAADTYIAFNATANVNSIKLAAGSAIDFWPANITLGEYFTVYAASLTTANFIITD